MVETIVSTTTMPSAMSEMLMARSPSSRLCLSMIRASTVRPRLTAAVAIQIGGFPGRKNRVIDRLSDPIRMAW